MESRAKGKVDNGKLTVVSKVQRRICSRKIKKRQNIEAEVRYIDERTAFYENLSLFFSYHYWTEKNAQL